MVPVKIQDPCDQRRGILWRQKYEVASRTGFVGDIFDAAGKNIDINNFKTDILADDIEEYQLDFEDTRYVKGELSNSKEFSHENWYQWEDSIYNYFKSRVNSHGRPLSYVIRKDTPIHK